MYNLFFLLVCTSCLALWRRHNIKVFEQTSAPIGIDLKYFCAAVNVMNYRFILVATFVVEMEDVAIISQKVWPALSCELEYQQQNGLFVDLVLAFSCGNTCSVHKCIVTAMSRYQSWLAFYSPKSIGNS